MTDMHALIDNALKTGFSAAGELNPEALEFLPEVRAMCAVDRCHSYGKNWTCPPACGTVDDATREAAGYRRGLLVQTVGQLEDDFDWETIAATSAKHRRNFEVFTAYMQQTFTQLMPMGAGACSICDACTYPDEPCRFPDKAFPPMEAYGLFVSRVCERSGMKYNHGPQTISFTSCYLFNEN